MAAIKIPLDQAPGIIADSAHSVLAAHGFTVARCNNDGTARQIEPSELAAVFCEIGRNASQALTSIDMLGDDADSCPRCPAVGTCVGCDRHHAGPDITEGHP